MPEGYRTSGRTPRGASASALAGRWLGLREAEQPREEHAGQDQSEEEADEIGSCIPPEYNANGVEEEGQCQDGEGGDQNPRASDIRFRVSTGAYLWNSPAAIPEQKQEDDTENASSAREPRSWRRPAEAPCNAATPASGNQLARIIHEARREGGKSAAVSGPSDRSRPEAYVQYVEDQSREKVLKMRRY